MKKRKYRQIVAAVLAAVMVFGTASDAFAEDWLRQSQPAQSETESALMTGLWRTEPLELELDEFSGAQYEAKTLAASAQAEAENPNRPDSSTLMKASQIYNDDWDQYSTNYYYNMMDDAQREFWDALDAMCLNYMNKKTDMNYYYGYYLTDYVYTDQLSKNDAAMVTRIFRYSNPQYYFLEPLFYTSELKNQVGISIVVYADFAKGKDRAAATKKFSAAIQSWLSEVDDYASDYEKVLTVHDLVCEGTDYNYQILNPDGSVNAYLEQSAMTQSAYSTFCMDYTVCAGYAQACELLCNALGIDAIVVTSEDHEWNKVRIEDSWYNVDCTWDDQGNATYTFFAKSDYSYNNVLSMASSHQMEALWDKYVPSCTLDSDSTYGQAGSIPAITDVTQPVVVTASPVYSQDKDTKKQYITSYKVTLSCATEGATIYYTTDGTEPTVASGKSKKYKKSFKITDASKLYAIAVCDQKYDSAVVEDDTFGAISYTIKYVMNGGENNEDNPSTYKATDDTFKLKTPTKTGYKFAGWYTDKSFASDKVTKIKKGSTGKLTLYAKWTPITYTVKFDGNGADSGSMKKKECKYGKSYTLTANKFKRSGYTFAGWSTKKNGKGTTYKNKGKIKNLTSKSGKTITLYAQWKKK